MTYRHCFYPCSNTFLNLLQSVVIILLLYICSVKSAHHSSSSKPRESSSAEMTSKIIKSLAKSAVFNARRSDGRPRPMRPVEPVANSVDYITPIINLYNNVRDLEHNLKKRTYSYGLMVVGRPLEELTLTQKLVRAALMPGKYYEDATSAVAKQLNHFVINKQPSKSEIHRKSKSRRPPTAKSFDWGDVILRLISLAASSIPTPVVKH